MDMFDGLPLASTSWGTEELQAIQSVIDSNQFTMGEKVKTFERAFANYFGARYAVMVNSGSSANLLMMAAMRYKSHQPLMPDDEVIVPSLSWSTTYYPVDQYQMKLVFVDIDPETLNIDINELEKAMSDKTRAILVPNILGNPAALIELKAFCEKHNLYLLEDNCESMGAKINEKYCGTHGILGTFSCFFSHHISTMEGGMVVTDDEELYELMLCMRSHGWTRHLPEQGLLHRKAENTFYESFNFIYPGYNLRPLEMSGAIGIEQLKKLSEFVAWRRKNAKQFQSIFSTIPGISIQKEHGEGSWFGFSIILNDDFKKTRDDVVRQLQEKGVECRPIISGNFLRHNVINHLNHRVVGHHPNANRVHDRGFFIGNHHYDIANQLGKIADVFCF